MMQILRALLLAAVAASAAAQAQSVPVEDLGVEQRQAVERGQYRAGHAYRAWKDASYEAQLAHQDLLNLEAAYQRASAEGADLKRQLDAARKALAAAQAKAEARRKAYDEAVTAVDRAWNGKRSSK